MEFDKAVVFDARMLALTHLPKLDACRTSIKLYRRRTTRYLNLHRLLPLVVISSDTIATDPRDKIYAIIGLAKELYNNKLGDLDSSVLLIDYAATVEDVYSSFVKAVVRATKRLDILGICCANQGHYVQRTWTPDSTSKIGTSILTSDIIRSLQWELENWTYNVSPDVECVARFATDLSTLTVLGLIWDEVISVSSNELREPWDRNIFRQHCHSILHFSEEIGKQRYIPQTQT